MTQLPLLCLNPVFRSRRYWDFSPTTFTLKGYQKQTRIANTNVMLQSYPQGLILNDLFMFTQATTLFVMDCHPDFVKKFIKRQFFPKVTALFLSSDPSMHHGIMREFSNVTVTDKHAKQLEIFKPYLYRRVINNGYLEAVLKSYEEDDLILEKDDVVSQELMAILNNRLPNNVKKDINSIDKLIAY